MKFTSLTAIAVALAVGTSAQAQNISSYFVNLDFDAGGTHIASGFDNPAADIIGWNNYGGIVDAGVEGPGAWWGPYEFQAAFMNGGAAAFNLGNYTIQAGDAFSVSFMAQSWQWTGTNGQWTATLFYDNPANVIGSYTTPGQLPENWQPWASYTSDLPIIATPESIGGKLGIIMSNTGTRIALIDEISVSIVPVPEPTTISLMALAGAGLFLHRRRK